MYLYSLESIDHKCKIAMEENIDPSYVLVVRNKFPSNYLDQQGKNMMYIKHGLLHKESCAGKKVIQ